jgi:RNA polymerase sigma-70 factor (ECF subfamily)
MNKSRTMSWEGHLIQQAALGDSIAFELLADRHRGTLRIQAMRILRNADDANDAVQETFLRAFRAIRDVDSDRPIKPWLSRICSNCCVDAVRSRRSQVESLETHEHHLFAPEAEPDEQAEESFVKDQIAQAVGRLPENYRRIVLMRHFQDKEVNEIATELDKPEGTIKSWLFRARAMLRKDLKIAPG